MKREFIIDRQGRSFVLYAGLLDLAHEKGLKSIKTTPVRVEDNFALFHATVEMEDGRVFQGTGDATPENVGRQVAQHFVRMGETRAKARALRDALNIGAAALEELGGDDDEPSGYQARQDRATGSSVNVLHQQAKGPQPTPIREQPRPAPRPVAGGAPGQTAEAAIAAQSPPLPENALAAWRAKADELHATMIQNDQLKNAPKAPAVFNLSQLQSYVTQWEAKLAAVTRNGTKAGV